MNKLRDTFFLVLVVIAANSCSPNEEKLTELQTNSESCNSDSGIEYICGPANAEDLLSIGDTGMLIASGMNGTLDGSANNGHIYLIDPDDGSWSDLVSDTGYSEDFAGDSYPECPGPLNTDDFSAHGLALRETETSVFDLYVTSHGAREAVEIFDLDMRSADARLTWKGCVPLDEAVMHNSVAITKDGGFITTQFMTWAGGLESVLSGEAEGRLVMWRPGGDPTVIPGTELEGPNGIVLSQDESYAYVAAFATGDFVRFDLSVDPIQSDSVSLNILPDNIRWGVPGMLLTAGGNMSGNGWSVVEINADTLEFNRIGGMDTGAALQGASSALQVGDTIWVGTYSGDRVGYFQRD